MTAPIFRRAVERDLPAIIAMLADDGLGAGREDASLPLDARYVAAFRALDADASPMLVVAEDPVDGSLLGTLQLGFLPGLSMKGMLRGQIESVRVRGDRRGQGLGRRMMDWAVETCRARGCGLVQLSSHLSRTDAIRFYESLGFKATHAGMKRML